jgi:ATP-binding cassette, subfamily B, bacterial PglK
MKSVINYINLLNLKQKFFFLFIICLTLIVTILEMLSIFLIFPIVGSILNENLGYNKYTNLILENFQTYLEIDKIIIFFIILYTIRLILLLLLNYLNQFFIFSIYRNFLNRLFSNYLNKPLLFHKKKNSSEVVRDIQENVGNIAVGITTNLSTIILESIMLIGLIVVLLIHQPISSLGILGGIVFLALLISQIMKKFAYRLSLKRQRENFKFIKIIYESFKGFKEIKIFSAENKIMNFFQKISKNIAFLNLNINFLNQSPRHILEYMLLFSIVIYFWYLSLIGYSSSQIISNLAVLGFILIRAMPIINKLVTSSINFSVHKTALELLYDDVLEKNIVEDKIQNLNYKKKIEFKKKFELKDVFFEYPDRKGNIFENVNISIKKGEIIGIVGESGSGKTTLIEIIMGLLKPTLGKVIIDDKYILNKENSKNWYSNVSYVPQNIFLNDDTIKNNITFSESKDTQVNYKINKSIILSGLKKFIKSLDKKLETNIGEMGESISGGQRQRLGIARALYKEHQLLILDEPTSALDEKTEANFLDVIKKLTKKRTIIIISHNITNLKFCDKIYELKNRKISQI